jgi:hypothetical protein
MVQMSEISHQLMASLVFRRNVTKLLPFDGAIRGKSPPPSGHAENVKEKMRRQRTCPF